MTRTAKKKHESGLREQIDRYIATASAATFNYKQVAAAIGEHNSTHHRSIAIYLAELAFDGVLLECRRGVSNLCSAPLWRPAHSCGAAMERTV